MQKLEQKICSAHCSFHCKEIRAIFGSSRSFEFQEQNGADIAFGRDPCIRQNFFNFLEFPLLSEWTFVSSEFDRMDCFA